MTKTRCSLTALTLCAAMAIGCSEGVSRQTLTGPSSLADPGTSAHSLNGDRSASSRPANAGEVAAWAASRGWTAAADGIAVEATEPIESIGGSCPDAIITVRGVPVAVNSSTVFAAPLTCETLAVGQTVTIAALVTVTDAGLTVTATTLGAAGDNGGTDGGSTPGTPTAPRPVGGGKKARGQGVVGAITGACPTITMVITGTKVSATAATEYVNGSCETLRPGTKVTIDGELNPGGTATADKIEIHRVPGRNVSGDGTVGQVSGACPALTLSVRGVRVVTSSATTFVNGNCADIRAGTAIDVTGEYDGTEVVATEVKIKRSK